MFRPLDLDPKPPGDQKNLRDYGAAGGRIFLTDWSHSWLKDGNSFQKAGTWDDFLPPLGVELRHPGLLVQRPLRGGARHPCGRVVYSTFHVVDEPEGKIFPSGCQVGPMTP